MKHPLTSKERRGLVAVAAAALLCICSGFIFRQCASRSVGSAPSSVIMDADSLPKTAGRDSADAGRDSITGKSGGKKKSTVSNGKRTRRAKRRNTEKTYPTRDPLSQPCDQ